MRILDQHAYTQLQDRLFVGDVDDRLDFLRLRAVSSKNTMHGWLETFNPGTPHALSNAQALVATRVFLGLPPLSVMKVDDQGQVQCQKCGFKCLHKHSWAHPFNCARGQCTILHTRMQSSRSSRPPIRAPHGSKRCHLILTFVLLM